MNDRQTHAAQNGAAILGVSLIFVLLWSTGHITSKLGLPYIEPFKFLTIRFFLSAILLGAIALAVRAPWPRDRRQLGHILVAGLLMHAAYLGGVFVSIHLGLAAGALAVITGIQPILTGVAVGPVFGERVSARQWVGLVLGFIGVGLIMWEKTKIEETASTAFIAAVLCLAAITVGTLYQKRFCGDHDIRSLNALQLGASAIVCGVVSFIYESGAVDWSGQLIFAIGWQVIVLSVITYSLFYWLLRQDEAIRVTSLFYLMPPTTALMGYFLFDETFGLHGFAGLFIAMLGFSVVYHFKRR
jgi:drug/metabolite transporter (DMT)-like permease